MLCVSTCRKEITPQGKFFPCYLMGHAIRTDPAEGIMDPLWATALVLEAEGGRFVWVTVELIGLERDYTERLQAEIEKKYGIPPERTNICFVHTHSAPEYQLHSLLGTPGAVPGYMDFVAEQILAAVDVYQKGVSFITDRSASLHNLTEVCSILGIIVLGAMVASTVNVNITYSWTVGDLTQNLGDLLNTIIPCFGNVVTTAILYWALGRKKMNSGRLIWIVIIVAIVLGALGICG